MGFRYTRNAHDCWTSFRDRRARLIALAGLPPIAFRSEARFRELLIDGSTRSAAGEEATLGGLDSDQWSSLCRFTEEFFDEFESYAPLDLFLAFRREKLRRRADDA